MSRSENQTAVTGAGQSKDWNWHPDLPVAVSPLFAWPPKPLPALRWFVQNWLPISEYMLYLVLAFFVWHFLQPSLETTQAFTWQWVFFLWGRNIILMTLVAAGLHLWLYHWRRQAQTYKYDGRNVTKTGPKYTFNSQLWDNVFWTLASGVTVWTLFEALIWWAFSNGFAPLVTFSDGPIWFVVLLLILPIWQSLHFYWVHRLLHWPPLYKYVHSLHHRNTDIGPWSGLSMHPVEHLIYLSALFIFLLVPSHPIHLLFLCFWLTLATATSHSGYENILLGDSAKLKIGSFFHQLHHRYFECNYGNVEMPWDRWFGSHHDGTPEATKRMHERMKDKLKKNRATD